MTNFLLALIALKLFDNGHGNNVNMTFKDVITTSLWIIAIVLFILAVFYFGFDLVLGVSCLFLGLFVLVKSGISEKRKIEKMKGGQAKEEPVKDESTKKGIHPIYNFLLFVFGLAFAVVLLMFYAETRP